MKIPTINLTLVKYTRKQFQEYINHEAAVRKISPEEYCRTNTHPNQNPFLPIHEGVNELYLVHTEYGDPEEWDDDYINDLIAKKDSETVTEMGYDT